MLTTAHNYLQESYVAEDYYRYFNSILTIYTNLYDYSPDGLELLLKIVNNIWNNPLEEKYKRLSMSKIINGKPGYLYQYFTSTDTGRYIIIMLGFKIKVHNFEEKWVLVYTDRIKFYPEIIKIIEKNKQTAINIKLKPHQEIAKKMSKDKERIESIKLKLAGDRVERKDINWVAKGKSVQKISNTTQRKNKKNFGIGGQNLIGQSDTAIIIDSSIILQEGTETGFCEESEEEELEELEEENEK